PLQTYNTSDLIDATPSINTTTLSLHDALPIYSRNITHPAVKKYGLVSRCGYPYHGGPRQVHQTCKRGLQRYTYHRCGGAARHECGRSDIRAIAQNWNCRQHHQDIANARWQHDRDYPRETTLPFNRSGAD